MKLSELLERIACFQDTLLYTLQKGSNIHSLSDIEIQGINSDSRLVQRGEIFGVFTPDVDQALMHLEQAVQRDVNVMVISVVGV
jgi:hypothetical protein